jgi:hypothetical protein
MNLKIYCRPLSILALSIVGVTLPLLILSNSGDGGFRCVLYVFSGEIFEPHPVIKGGAFDQQSLHKGFYLLCYSVLIILPCIAFVRWINKRAPRIQRLVFASISTIILIHPFSFLALFGYEVLRYISHMGFTPMRLLGLVIAFIGFEFLRFLVVWIWRLRRNTQPETCNTKPGEA